MGDERAGGGAGSRVRRASGLAAGLVWVAGYVDAIGFLVLQRVFTANMSGNTIHLGIEWGQDRFTQGASRLVAIGAFLVGGMVAEALLEEGRRRGWRSKGLAATLVVEDLALVGFVGAAAAGLGWTPGGSAHGSTLLGLIALAATAMGAQNASLRHAGGIRIHTTHVTGELTRVSREIVSGLYAWRDRRRNGRGTRPSDSGLARIARLAGYWALYIVGAILGTWALSALGLQVLAAPVILLAVLVALVLGWGLEVGVEEDERWWRES